MSNEVYDYLSSLPLSPLAFSFDGTVIDSTVPGYRTTAVAGRESLSADVEETEYAVRPGSLFKKRRNVTRDITVSFDIITDNKDLYLNSFNKLKGILNPYDQTEKQIIFNDDSEYYWTGSVTDISSEEVNIRPKYAAQGTITIHCTDPCKYAVEETTVSATTDSDGTYFIFDYDGTASVPFKISFTTAKAEDYIILTNQDKRILAFGSAQLYGTDYYESSETLFNVTKDNASLLDDFLSKCKYVTNGWAGGSYYGIDLTTDKTKAEVYRAAGHIIWDNDANHYGDIVALRLNSPSTWTNWGGAAIEYDLPADSNGNTDGAQWWYLYFRTCFVVPSLQACGMIQYVVLDANNNVIAATVLDKNDVSDSVWLDHWVGNKKVDYMYITGGSSGNPSRNSTLTFTNGQYSIERRGDTGDVHPIIHFQDTMGAKDYDASSVKDLKATKIVIVFCRLKSYAVPYAMGPRAMNFRKDFGPSEYYIKNKFAKYSEIEIDTSSGFFKVNGQNKLSYGALGNDWESFDIKPGSNTISFTGSSGTAPTDMKLTFRKAFI